MFNASNVDSTEWQRFTSPTDFTSPLNLNKHVERVHPGHKEQYKKIVAAGRKQKADNMARNTSKKLKQLRTELMMPYGRPTIT